MTNFQKLKYKIWIACGELLSIREMPVLCYKYLPDYVTLTNKDLME